MHRPSLTRPDDWREAIREGHPHAPSENAGSRCHGGLRFDASQGRVDPAVGAETCRINQQERTSPRTISIKIWMIALPGDPGCFFQILQAIFSIP